MKLHIHSEQFDGARHAWCGRAPTGSASILTEPQFEAAPTEGRCKLCAREWFPRGQPDWHHTQAVAALPPPKAP